MSSGQPPGDSEKRKVQRCPICDGPLYAVESKGGTLRCRNSLCVYNHRNAKCPRCGVNDIKSAWFAGGEYFYSCKRCLASWSEA